jgi:hypothetical protein
MRRQAREHAREAMEEARERVREEMERQRERMEELRERQREEMEEHRERQREEMEERRARMEEEHERAREHFRRSREEWHEAREETRRAVEEWQRSQGGDVDYAQAVQVKGPIRFHLELIGGDITVTTGGNEVRVSGEDCMSGFSLDTDEDEVEVDFQGLPRCGSMTITVPSGSDVEIESVEGDVSLSGTYDQVEISAVSGDVSVGSAQSVDIEAVNGAVRAGKVLGAARIETVSGDVELAMPGSAPRVDFSSMSGSLSFTGACGRGCKIDSEVFSGDVQLNLSGGSSFEMKYRTHSGDLQDGLGLGDAGKRGAKGRYGAGEGRIEVESYQGNLQLTRR